MSRLTGKQVMRMVRGGYHVYDCEYCDGGMISRMHVDYDWECPNCSKMNIIEREKVTCRACVGYTILIILGIIVLPFVSIYENLIKLFRRKR